MAFSIGLLLLACGASAWLAYGIDPRVAREFGGLELICLSRRLQWVLVLASVLPCLVLVVRVMLGRSRAWWLIGLSAVLAMLFVRFGPGTVKPVRVLDGEALPPVSQVMLPSEDEYVVGFDFGEHSYAIPQRSLVRTPIVQLTDFDRRVLIVASPPANLVSVIEVPRTSRAEDYDYVAQPGNSTLVYNRKNGTFINGVTATNELCQPPAGTVGVLPCYRLTLRQWRVARPKSLMMPASERDLDFPGVPLAPAVPPRITDTRLPANTPITLLHTDPPLAVPAGVDAAGPLNFMFHDRYYVLWRDGPLLRAFDRRFDDEQVLSFVMRNEPKKGVRIVDEQTNSTWTIAGHCIEGPMAGESLKSIRVDENVYWGVCKEWWPRLELARP